MPLSGGGSGLSIVQIVEELDLLVGDDKLSADAIRDGTTNKFLNSGNAGVSRDLLETLTLANRLNADSVKDGTNNKFLNSSNAGVVRDLLETLLLDDRLNADSVKEGTTNKFVSTQQQSFIQLASKLALSMIQVVNNGTDADHDLDFIDPNETFFSGTITKQADAIFASGTGAGMLDTGVLASDTLYYLFIIKKTSDGTYDILASTSRTNPAVPNGYEQPEFFWAWVSDSSNNLVAASKLGLVFKADGGSLIADVTDSSITSNAFETGTFTVPPRCVGIFNMQVLPSANQTLMRLSMKPTSNTQSSNNQVNCNFSQNYVVASINTNGCSFEVREIVDENQQAKYSVSESSGTNTLTITTLGFEIPLSEMGA